MKKRTKQYTRKHLALRRWLLALALFFLAYSLLPSTFSPTQTIRFYERANAIERTTVVQWKKAGPRLFCLSKNENVLFLTGHYFHPLYGWMDFGALPLDLTQEEGPVAARGVGCSLSDKGWRHLMIFGIVRQQKATAVRVKDALMRIGETGDYLPSNQVWTGEIQTGKDGHQYFWFGQDLEYSIGLLFETLEVLDDGGRVLCTYDLTEKYGGIVG